MKSLLFVIGTRPEAIKMAPLLLATRQHPSINATALLTGQHGEVVQNVLRFFGIETFFALPEIESADINTRYVEIQSRMNRHLSHCEYDGIVVQGDTMSTYCGAMAGFLNDVPVAHLEAGLRTDDARSPFPEEMNRRLVSQLAKWHFTPTSDATAALAKDGISNNVFEVGNTAVDAILLAKKRLELDYALTFKEQYPYLNRQEPTLLVTLHRRELWDDTQFDQVAKTIESLCSRTDFNVVFCLHPNPVFSNRVKRALGPTNCKLVEALPYPDFVWHMMQSQVILSDSGGVQEEAPSLGVPVCVARQNTERLEGTSLNYSTVTGFDPDAILSAVDQYLDSPPLFQDNPYGSGETAPRVLDLLENLI